MSHQRRPLLVWLILLLSIVYIAYFAFTIYVVASHYGVVKYAGWALRATGDGWFVSQVDADGPAARQVDVGDRLLALNGDDRAAVIGSAQFRDVEGGAMYRVDFDRRGQRVSLSLPLTIVRGRRLDPIILLVGLVFFSCGFGLAMCGRTISRCA